MDLELDLSFLQLPITAPAPTILPVNVYEILREGWRESRVDMTLRFFFDPVERHELGSLVVDALLRCLDDAPLIGEHGHSGFRFDAVKFQNSADWEVATQMEYVDVLLTNSALGIAIVLENKITAELNNPLDVYSKVAMRKGDYPTVLTVVLAPEVRNVNLDMARWLSRSITYDQLFHEVKQAPELVTHLIDPMSLNQKRSLELLQQFMEARRNNNMLSHDEELPFIDQWRSIMENHLPQIQAFENARTRIGRIFSERRARLEEPIANALAAAGLHPDEEWHGGNARVNEFFNAYLFQPENWHVELKLSQYPPLPTIYVQDFGERNRNNVRSARKESLGLSWDASDEEIAAAFVVRVLDILDEVRESSLGLA